MSLFSHKFDLDDVIHTMFLCSENGCERCPHNTGLDACDSVNYEAAKYLFELKENLTMPSFLELKERVKMSSSLPAPVFDSILLDEGVPFCYEENTTTPKRVIHNGCKTIVIWEDDTKTIVTREEGVADNPYLAFCAAVTKRVFGSTDKAIKAYESTLQRSKRKAKALTAPEPEVDAEEAQQDEYAGIEEEAMAGQEGN